LVESTSHGLRPDEELLGRLRGLLEPIEHRLASIEERLRGSRRDYYRVEELATLVGRSEYSIRRWIKQGKLKATRLEGTGPRGFLLVPRDQVERLIRIGEVTDVPAITAGQPRE
jgi:excisionase family DNA binding protein